VYVESSNVQNTKLQPEELDATLQDMVMGESVCQKILAFLKDEALESTIKLDGKEVGGTDRHHHISFVADSVFFYLVYGFVPFKLKKVDSQFFAEVISYDQIQYEVEERDYEDSAPKIQVTYRNSNIGKSKEKKPRIFVYTFSNSTINGAMYAALTEYKRLTKARLYEQDCFDLNRSSLLFLQRSKPNESAPDYGKMNVGQILSVSDQFRVNMDNNTMATADAHEEKQKTVEIKEEVDKQAASYPAIQKFCANVSLPENSTGHLYHFRPPTVDMNNMSRAFHEAVLDTLNLPRSWCDQGRNNKRERTSATESESQSHKNEKDGALQCSARVCAELSKMMSFVLSLINDKTFHSKLVSSQADVAPTKTQKSTSLNIVNIYSIPTHEFVLEKPIIKDVSFLLDMYKQHIITHDDFSHAFQYATGMKVDPALKKIRTKEYDSQMFSLTEQMRPSAATDATSEPQNMANEKKKADDKNKAEKKSEQTS
tara:strand:- start:16018 stop:17469 length:1452 start_codon:yes stop_codon:yes gene_type:complete